MSVNVVKTVEVIPTIIEATGVVEKNLKTYLNRIAEHYNIYKLHN